MCNTALHLHHSARNLVTKGRFTLVVMLLGSQMALVGTVGDTRVYSGCMMLLGPHMALVGMVSGTRVCSGCSLRSLALSMGTLEPSHQRRLGSSRRSGSATAVEHGDG